MEVALIPPIPHLQVAHNRSYHLTLVHLVDRSKEYPSFYRGASQRGAYVILDNSAHEQTEGQPIEILLRCAPKVGAREIVLPDKLFDSLATFTNAVESLQYLRDYQSGALDKFHWMFVPQGEDFPLWQACLEEFVIFLSKRMLRNIQVTIGVSKDYEEWEGGLYSLLRDSVIPEAEKIGAEIHLLGWGRDLWALEKISKDFGEKIRSMDTTKPFTYARDGVDLASSFAHRNNSQKAPEYPRRKEDHFSMILDDSSLQVLESNIQVLDSLVYRGAKRREIP